MPIEILTAYAVAVASIAAVVLQLIKVGIIDPRSQESPARDALLRALSYVLNLGGLLAVVAINGQLDGHSILAYLSLAFGQTVASHVAYSTLSAGGNPAPADVPSDSVSEPIGG